ncbi:hypothetical protein [Paenibacillus hamazuiensis]|uniref:hypothetical protein n=1 Tax=Paenibacillus hamazuiensis TaxID=2936508 RepID=UPI00200D830E|nr:hypothetical protein [Paenibacillus hamazuiensis]
MNAKKLPIKQPFIDGYKHHAMPLSIISLFEESEPWILSNYIQLYTRKYLQDVHWLDFYLLDTVMNRPNNPFVTVQRTDRTVIGPFADPIEVIIRCIEQDKYVPIEGDQYYLPHCNSYMQHHRVSGFLAYGFDREQEIIHIMDYSYTTNNRFESLTLSFAEMRQSFLSEVPGGRAQRIWMLKPVSKPKYVFNLNVVQRLLEDYVTGTNHAELTIQFQDHPLIHTADVVYGIRVYDHLEHYLHLLLEEQAGNNVLPFQVLWEHKKCIGKLLRYLREKEYAAASDHMIEGYSAIEDGAFIIRSTFFKYTKTGDKACLQRILERMRHMAAAETAILSEVLVQIKARCRESAERIGFGNS